MNIIRKIIDGSIVIHPFLFAVYPVVFLFSHNVAQVSFPELFLPLAVVLAFAAMLALVLGAAYKDKMKAGILVSLFMVLTFSYGHVLAALEVAHFPLFIVWTFCLCVGALVLAKTRRDLTGLTRFLNVVALILVMVSVINIFGFKLSAAISGPGKGSDKNVGIEKVSAANLSRLPDIYYIIFDRYASAKTLKDVYGYDNEGLLSYLQGKGFYIASKSCSNYPFTAPSLASSFNLEYLAEDQADSGALIGLYEMLQDYKVWRFLKARGYKFIHFGAGWHPLSQNRYADQNHNYYFPNEFTMFLYEKSMFYPVLAKFFDFDRRRQKYHRALYKFSKLKGIPEVEGPTYTFAHFSLPHQSYVFDKDGEFVSRGAERAKGRRAGYLDQLIFTNKMIRKLVDELLAGSDDPPIIVLQADEGPYPLSQELDRGFKWGEVTDKELAEKMRIISAYYLPGPQNKGLYSSISPVNSFRLIFNAYFDAQFSLLPDESFLHRRGKFVNVTSKVKYDQ